MHQILFYMPFFGFPVYSYGLMMVIGFVGAIQLAKFLARRSGIDPEIFVNAGLIALVTGIIGARLSHVLENIGTYTDPNRSIGANLFDAINIRSGGLTYYGGFLLAFPALVFYAWKKKLPVRLGMDIVAPCLVIGLGFGRIGCFLNGCCYGATCDVPWAVTFPYGSIPYDEEVFHKEIQPPAELLTETSAGDVRLLDKKDIARGAADPSLASIMAAEHSLPVHPAQLYSAFTAFLIAGIGYCFFTLPHAPGRAFALVLMLEGSSRFILEMLRVEPPVIGTFSLSMLIGLIIAAVGVLLWFVFGMLDHGNANRAERNPLAATLGAAPVAAS